MKKRLYAAILALGLTSSWAAEKPKLILQITVDQLRGDLPEKYMKHMGDGGFRYLKSQGIWYSNAHYTHSNTETVVGHSILATGADPAVNGMISNVWFDRKKGRLVYNIEDENCELISEKLAVDKATEIDASQVIAAGSGRSPRNIMVSTFSDELKMSNNGASKVFGVSVKDRGAVTMAGHAGKAFWFSKKSGNFVTSTYYYKSYPTWAKQWNALKLAQSYANKSWSLLQPKENYMFKDEDDMPWETDESGFGRTFPHQFGPISAYLYSFLTLTPVGDDLTLSFAKALLEGEQLGQDEVTDYLSISFSSTDYVGHLFGPSSLEAEDNMLRLDRTLADLFKFIDQKVGLKNTLIVLCADHGAPEAPGYLKQFGIDSGYVSPDHWDKEPAIARLKKKFGIAKKLVHKFFPPYLYLNEKVIKEKGLDVEMVERAVAKEVMNIKGVQLAVSRFALEKNELPNTYLNRKAMRNFNPNRSGNLLILFEPHYFINDFCGEMVTVNHGGPWEYDSFVPIIFAGNNLKPQRISRRVEPKDIALTLSNYLKIKVPSGADGQVLKEVVE